MELWCRLSNSGDIAWDDDHPVEWDDNGQQDKARALVHGGQNSYFPNMTTAAGKAFMEFAQRATNHLGNFMGGGLENFKPEDFGSPERIKAAEIADKPAFDAPGGRFAQIVADTAATAPIGGPIEAGIAKLGMGPLGKSLLARVATSAPVRASASGAAVAGINAEPGQGGTAALEGAGVGGVLGATQKVLGRLGTGVVKKSDALKLLEGDVARTNAIPGASQRDLFVPISQGADPNDPVSSTIGGMYRGALPYIPGTAAQLARQSNKGLDTMMGTMLQASAPTGYIVPSLAVNDMQLSTSEVKKAYDRIYNNLRQVNNIKIPNDFNDQLKTRIQAADPQIPVSDVDAYVTRARAELDKQAENSKDGMINGWNLKNARDNIQGMNGELPMPQRAGLTNTTKAYVDDIFSDKLKQAFNLNHQNTQDILTSYKANAPNYENFRPLNEAVNAPGALSASGSFRPGAVAGKANPFTDMQGMDQSFKAVFGQKAVSPSAAARVAGYPITSGAAYYLGHFPAVAALLAGGNALATKTAQKGLYNGVLGKTMAKFIKDNPGVAEMLGYTGRSAITSDIGVD